MRILLGVVVAVSVAGFGLGVWLVLHDLSSDTDSWHGLLIVVGLGLMVGAVTAGVLAVLATLLAERRPVVARTLAMVLAVVGAMLCYPLLVDTSWGWVLAPFPLALAATALLPDRAAR